MTTCKDDPAAEAHERLTLFARQLVTATPECRADQVGKIRATAIPATLELLVETLLKLLDREKTHAGAAEVLVALGTGALSALESAVLKKQPEQRLVRLAPIFVAIGRQLPERKQVDLQMTLGIAAGLTRILKGRVALEGA